MTKPHWETDCPKSSDDGLHCMCWYDGETCCDCGDPAAPDKAVKAEDTVVEGK